MLGYDSECCRGDFFESKSWWNGQLLVWVVGGSLCVVLLEGFVVEDGGVMYDLLLWLVIVYCVVLCYVVVLECYVVFLLVLVYGEFRLCGMGEEEFQQCIVFGWFQFVDVGGKVIVDEQVFVFGDWMGVYYWM